MEPHDHRLSTVSVVATAKELRIMAKHNLKWTYQCAVVGQRCII